MRQRTARKETTKDKTGALSLAVYTKQPHCAKVDLLAGLGNDFNFGDQLVGLSTNKSFPTF